MGCAGLEGVGAGAGGHEDDDIGVTIEAVAEATDGAHDVLVAGQFGAEAAHMDIDGPFGQGVGGLAPDASDELVTVDRAAFAEHEELEKFELLVGEVCRFAVDQGAFAGDVDDDAVRVTVGIVIEFWFAGAETAGSPRAWRTTSRSRPPNPTGARATAAWVSDEGASSAVSVRSASTRRCRFVPSAAALAGSMPT